VRGEREMGCRKGQWLLLMEEVAINKDPVIARH